MLRMEDSRKQNPTTGVSPTAPESTNTVRRTINVSALNSGVMQGLDAIQQLNASIYSNSSQAKRAWTLGYNKSCI